MNSCILQGVPKKCAMVFLTITPKRKGIGSKVRPFSENSGNSAHLMDTEILKFDYLEAEKIEF